MSTPGSRYCNFCKKKAEDVVLYEINPVYLCRTCADAFRAGHRHQRSYVAAPLPAVDAHIRNIAAAESSRAGLHRSHGGIFETLDEAWSYNEKNVCFGWVVRRPDNKYIVISPAVALYLEDRGWKVYER